MSAANLLKDDCNASAFPLPSLLLTATIPVLSSSVLDSPVSNQHKPRESWPLLIPNPLRALLADVYDTGEPPVKVPRMFWLRPAICIES
jgi:hypothetical protein